MDDQQLPLLSPATGGRTSTDALGPYTLMACAHEQARISPKNPRYGVVHADGTLDTLADEITASGQLVAAEAELGGDGVPEILAGSRRREACKRLGILLQLRVYERLTTEQALAIAHRAERGSLVVPFWDTSATWKRMLDDGTAASEARLVELLKEDKSTINRGLALQRAPTQVLALFQDGRALTQTQWVRLAPLLEDETTRAKMLARAALLAGRRLSAPAVAKELMAAAADKEAIAATEVRNRHGKIIATVTPDGRGGFTTRIRSMNEAHPTYRLEWLKLVNESTVEVVKAWFAGDG